MLRRLLSLATALALSSCANHSATNGRTDRAQFLQQVWASPKIKNVAIPTVYHSVYIAPVHTGHLAAQDWWKSQNSRMKGGELARDAAHLATHFRTQLAEAILSYPGNTLKVVSSPGHGTLVIHLAITELVPSKAYWNTAATAAGFIVPGAGLLSVAGSGSIAIEGRLTDGGTGETVGSFSDRRTDPMSPINLRSYKWYGGAEMNIDNWAKEASEVLHAPPGKIVYRPSPFTLKPF